METEILAMPESSHAKGAADSKDYLSSQQEELDVSPPEKLASEAFVRATRPAFLRASPETTVVIFAILLYY